MKLSLGAKKTSLIRRFKTWAARRFLARVQRITHRMPVELKKLEKARVMVLAPHMDDEVIGAGGTLALHNRLGSSIGIVFTTDSAGPSKTNPMTAIRSAEAREVAKNGGFEILDILLHPDGNLSLHEKRLASELAHRMKQWKPEQIFVPFPGDHHRDHQATSAALALAIEKSGWRGTVWCYEIWSTLWPNVEIDIGEAVQAKRDSIALYKSQVGDMSYIESALGLNRYRGLKVRVPFAEAFHVADASEYVELAATLREV